jgi:hypothetical protein
MTAAFWKGLGERALKTFCQALIAAIGTGAVGLLDVDWRSALSVSAMAALVSVLTSLASPSFTAGAPATVEVESDGVVIPDTVPTGDGDVTSEDAGGQPVTEPKHAEGVAAS